VAVQRAVETQNEYGEASVSWNLVATVWAAVEPLRGREYLQADQVQAAVDTRIRMRYLDGVVPKMRVVWDGHTYDIESVINPATRGRELELMARELL
jgi:SPP1 family predicted phage head-tail adaptor